MLVERLQADSAKVPDRFRLRPRRKARAKGTPTPPPDHHQSTSDGQNRDAEKLEPIPAGGLVTPNYTNGHPSTSYGARLAIANSPAQITVPQALYENPGQYRYEDESSLQAAAGYGHGRPNMPPPRWFGNRGLLGTLIIEQATREGTEDNTTHRSSLERPVFPCLLTQGISGHSIQPTHTQSRSRHHSPRCRCS